MSQSFSEQCAAWAAEVEAAPQKIVAEAAEEIFERAKHRTPVLTGRLRDAWQMEVGDAEATIHNDLPYAEKVEHGSSKQQPQGMLGISVAEVAAESDAVVARALKRE